MLRRAALVAVVAGLAAAPAAEAKLQLTFDRASAKPGQRVTLTFGRYFESENKVVRVYLVHAPVLGSVVRPAAGGGTVRFGPPPRIDGVHPVGQASSGSKGLTFRVPRVKPGRYAAVLWCATCRSPALLAVFQGGIPDDAAIRPTKALLRVKR